MSALKYVFAGMGCLGLLILGSCSIMSYHAINAVESATDRSAETFEQFETTMNEQIEEERNEELFGEPLRDYEDDANEGTQ